MKINIVFLVLLIAKFYLVNNQEADMNTFIENLINSSQDLKQEKQEIESIVFGKKRNLSRMRQINLGFSSNQLSFKQVNSTTNDSNNSFNNSYSKPFEPKRKGFWLKIKSTSFLNKITYPDTPLATKIHNLEFDDEGFKINEKAKRYLASKLIKNKIIKSIYCSIFFF